MSALRLVHSPSEDPYLRLYDPVARAAEAVWQAVGEAYASVSAASWDGPAFLKRVPSRDSAVLPRPPRGGALLQSQPPGPSPIVNTEFKRWLQSDDGKHAFSTITDLLHTLLDALFLRHMPFTDDALACPVTR